VPRAFTGGVYNLEVEEDHSYCTPALTIHNCIVPRLEGLAFTLDRDFQPAPILCDNNLSALPADFQEHILRRYAETGTRLLDANSAFEPRTFDEGVYPRGKRTLRGPWRFAFDEMRERRRSDGCWRSCATSRRAGSASTCSLATSRSPRATSAQKVI